MANLAPETFDVKLREKPYSTFYSLLNDAEKYQGNKEHTVECDILIILENKLSQYRQELNKQFER